jgi:hypothetical protein
LTFLRDLVPETPLLPKDIYNQNAQFRRDIRQGYLATEGLIQHLQDKGIKHSILKERGSNRLKGLFIACPELIQYLQSHYNILLIDNTYKTNRFDLPLIDIIGIDYNNKSFFAAFAFLPDKTKALYT